MGRIKSALIKRIARALVKEENNFGDEFEGNKKLIGNTMPSKRLRNRIAGYVTRLNKNLKKKEALEEKESQ